LIRDGTENVPALGLGRGIFQDDLHQAVVPVHVASVFERVLADEIAGQMIKLGGTNSSLIHMVTAIGHRQYDQGGRLRRAERTYCKQT
jgi:hypothetical protein